MSSSPLSTVPSTPNAPPTEQRGRASVRTPPNAGRSMSEDTYETPRAIRRDMAPLFEEGQTVQRPFFERKSAPIVFVPSTQIPRTSEKFDNPFAQARGAIPQRFAVAAGLGSNNKDNELHIADGVHSMTSADVSDYESLADSEQGSPIPRTKFRIARARHQTPATRTQATNQDTRTLAKVLATIGRLEDRMDQLGNQFRMEKGPITQGLFGPTRRNDIPEQPLRKEVDDMALLVANINATLETKIGLIQLQAKEYEKTLDSFSSPAFIKAVADEVVAQLGTQDKTKDKGKGKAPTERRITPAIPLPTVPSKDDEDMDWAAVVEETEKAER